MKKPFTNILQFILFLLSSLTAFNAAAQCHAGSIVADHDTVCKGATIIMNTTGSTGNIQWQSSANATGPFIDISGATNTYYAFFALPFTPYFRTVATAPGCADTSVVKYFEVNPVPTSAFTSDTSGLSASFNSAGSTGNATYQWYFGDSKSDTSKNPVHAYTTADTYNVCLVVTNSFQCSTTACNNVTVTLPGACFAGNIALMDTSCPGTAFFLQLQGSNGNLQWQYSNNANNGFRNIHDATYTGYDDNITTTTYYRVIASKTWCADTSGVIKVFVPQAPFVSYKDSVAGLQGFFTVDSISGVTSFKWYFGDNTTDTTHLNAVHTYADSGEYNSSLEVLNQYGCFYYSFASIKAPPDFMPCKLSPISGNNTYFQCYGYSAGLRVSGTGSLQWQEEDSPGHFVNIPGATTGSYETDGHHDEFRVVNTTYSCTDTTQEYYINYAPPLVASFNYSITGNTVTFNSDSSRGGSTFLWTFGDGSQIVTTPKPVYTYSSPGSYRACLELGNLSCSGDKCDTIIILPSGIEEVQPQHTMSINPNPCTNCEVSGVTEERALIVTDILGVNTHPVFSRTANGFLIHLTNSPTGIYFVKNINTGEVIKFIKAE